MLQSSAEKSSLQQALSVEHILAVLNLFILWLSVPPYNCLALNCKLGSQFVLSSQVPSKTVIFACLDSSCQSLLIKNCLLILNKMSDIWRSNGQPGLDCQCHSFNKAILLKLGALLLKKAHLWFIKYLSCSSKMQIERRWIWYSTLSLRSSMKAKVHLFKGIQIILSTIVFFEISWKLYSLKMFNF